MILPRLSIIIFSGSLTRYSAGSYKTDGMGRETKGKAIPSRAEGKRPTKHGCWETTNKAWVLGNDRFKQRIQKKLDRRVEPKAKYPIS